jgi:hypothetical protein
MIFETEPALTPYLCLMTNPFDPTLAAPDGETARTYRQLRLMKALIRLDDPELEQALTLIVERLAAAGGGGDLDVSTEPNPSFKPAE